MWKLKDSPYRCGGGKCHFSVMNHPETLQSNLLESVHTFLIFRFEVLGGQDGGNQVIGDETISIVEAPVNPPVNLPSISELPGKKIKLSV